MFDIPLNRSHRSLCDAPTIVFLSCASHKLPSETSNLSKAAHHPMLCFDVLSHTQKNISRASKKVKPSCHTLFQHALNARRCILKYYLDGILYRSYWSLFLGQIQRYTELYLMVTNKYNMMDLGILFGLFCVTFDHF